MNRPMNIAITMFILMVVIHRELKERIRLRGITGRTAYHSGAESAGFSSAFSTSIGLTTWPMRLSMYFWVK